MSPEGGRKNLALEFGGTVAVERVFVGAAELERGFGLAGVAGVGYGVCRCVGVGFLDLGMGGFVIGISTEERFVTKDGVGNAQKDMLLTLVSCASHYPVLDLSRV